MANNHYTTIVGEMETGTFRKEVWLQALEQSNGNHTSATRHYIRLRAEQLYVENTSAPKRALISVSRFLNPRTAKGLAITSALVLGLFLLGLTLAQPALQENARLGYQKLCLDSKDIVGFSQQELLGKFGRPDLIDTSGSAFLVYIYNPGSAFCFGKKQYNFKIFVDTRTVRVTGWEENPLLRITSVAR